MRAIAAAIVLVALCLPTKNEPVNVEGQPILALFVMIWFVFTIGLILTGK